MKNYLFKSLFKVQDPNWEVLDRSHETNMYDNYLAMHEYSVKSFQHNLGGEWELVFLHGEVENINQAFESTFWAIHNLWHQEPCNILYTDPDTVAIGKIDPWNEFDKFMMFNYTDPKTFVKDNVYGKTFEHWFNAGVRFFPSSMSEEVWVAGAALAKQWNHSSYNTEQIILNTMLWMQDIDLATALRPDLAYQGHWFPNASVETHNTWNGIEIEKSKILHLHGSRNSEAKLNIMKSFFTSNET